MQLMRWFSAWRARRRMGRRGAISMLAIFTVPVVLGFGGMAVDASYLDYRAAQLRAATDAAVLAGSALLPDATAASNAAIAYAEKNMPVATYGTVLHAADVQTGTWNSSTRTFTAGGTNPTAIKVTLRRTAANGNAEHFLFAAVLGFGSVDMVRSAVATYGTASAWDVMLVQDVSMSFSTQILNSKAADAQLISCQGNHAGSASQSGLTVFTGFGTVKSQMGAANILTAITGLNQCGLPGMPACSGSNIAAGLYQALQAMTGGNYHPSSNLAGKAVVLLTDGIPNVSNSAQPYGTAQGGTYTCPTSGSGRNRTATCSDSDLQAFAQAQADALWSHGISVFTVFYSGNSGNVASDSAYLASLVRGVGKAYVTPSASQLSAMMTNVCASMPHALVQ